MSLWLGKKCILFAVNAIPCTPAVAGVDVSFLFYFLHIFLHFCAGLSCLYNVCGHEAPMAVSSHPHQARLGPDLRYSGLSRIH